MEENAAQNQNPREVPGDRFPSSIRSRTGTWEEVEIDFVGDVRVCAVSDVMFTFHSGAKMMLRAKNITGSQPRTEHETNVSLSHKTANCNVRINGN